MTGVPAGNYLVQFQGARDETHRTPTEVFVTTDGQELSTSGGEAGSRLKVKIQLRGSTKPPSPLTILLRSKGRIERRVEANEQGEVDLSVDAGEYNVVAGSPSKQYSVAKISGAGEDIAGNRLTVPAGVSLNLTMLLVGGSVTVEGVAQRSGRPAPGAMVVLVPGDPGANLDLFRRDQSDQDGTFAVRQVVPGSYTILAIENGWDLDWAKPEVLEGYLQRGQKIMVGEASKGTLHLQGPVEVQTKQDLPASTE
jgi:hypothetical protein